MSAAAGMNREKEAIKMKELVIRQAVPKDAEAIARLEKLCFSEPWSYDSIYHELAANRRAFYLAADLCGRLVGYAGLWLIGDEGHITNVAVDPQERGRGIGDLLVGALIEDSRRLGAVSHTLEVRTGNAAAISLYEKHGFAAAGVRPGYYEDNGEDAIIMWRKQDHER